ncbi:DUF535 family protein [Brucella endophytica]|nr:DUF535 family protein [Brucella endophytica]
MHRQGRAGHWQEPLINPILRQAAGLGFRLRVRKAAAFWLRSLIFPRLTLRWFRFLSAFSEYQTRVPPHDDILRKSLSTFLVYRMPRREKLDLLMQHFEIAGEILRPKALDKLWQGGTVNAGTVAGRDQAYRLELSLAENCGCRHEGAFSLCLKRSEDGMALCMASFIFTRAGGGSYSIVIGGMQGPRGEEAKRAVISATRDLGGLRPKDAVLLALRGMMTRSAVSYLMAVSNARHAINQRAAKRRCRMRADLDGYWTERGGVHFPPFGFRIPFERAAEEGTGSRRDASKAACIKAGASVLRH